MQKLGHSPFILLIMTKAAKCAAAANRTWADPVIRAKRVAGLSRHAKTVLWGKKSKTRKKLLVHLKTFSKTPEQRKANSERTTKAWATKREQFMTEKRQKSYGPERADHLQGRPAWNKGLTKETDKRLAAVSEKLRGRVPDYGKYRAWYDGANGRIQMRSKWEVAYAEYLDRRGISWKYEPRWFDLGNATYTPDFLLTKKGRYVEIKGRMTRANARKLARFARVYPEIRLTILTRVELVAKGVLDCHGCAILAKAA